MRRTAAILLVLVTVLVSVAALWPRTRPIAAVTSERERFAFLDAQRAGIVTSGARVPDLPVGSVIELPVVPRIRLKAMIPMFALKERGGNLGPDGVFTLPNTEVPFLFAFGILTETKTDGRFVFLAPPARGIPRVPGANDLPPVVASRGEDRTVWTGQLPLANGRYLLNPKDRYPGLAMIAGDFPAPRVGDLAPRTLPPDALPRTGILLGRTILVRSPPRSFRLVRPHLINAYLERHGAPKLPFLAETIIVAQETEYEARTIYHVYRRSGNGWRYATTRAVTATASAFESSDADALAGAGLSPRLRSSGAHPLRNERFQDAQVPGRSLVRGTFPFTVR